MKKEYKFSSLGIKQNFLGIAKKYSSFQNSPIVILSCPYEKTTSYGKGTKNGPEAILKASHYVEFFDEETESEICFEKGICTLRPLNFKNLKNKKALEHIYKSVKSLIDQKKFVVTLGGEHSISSAIIKAHFDSFDNLTILHFDAHSDLRNEYEDNIYSHASFAARVAEFTTNIIQIGIRAQCREEFEFIKQQNIKTHYAHQIRKNDFDNNFIEKILNDSSRNVYITFDVDYFDPSIMPSTGTPEPGGFFWDETLNLFKMVIKKSNLVGFDVVELSPRKDFPFPDFLTAKFIYKILSYKFS